MNKQTIAAAIIVAITGLMGVLVAEAASPIVYSYSISSGNPTATVATITWTTNTPTNSVVNYGLTSSYGSASSSAALVTSHSITLSGLAAATTYHYQISSTDAQSNVATSSDLTLTTVNQCSYYVDSVSGSDANAGTDASVPLQHLAAVPVVTSGATICLRRGSVFKDSLYVGIVGVTSAINNITVQDYGPVNLAMPLIDNGDAIPAGAWSLSPGTTNVYQATVPGPGTSTTTPYGVYNSSGNIWINVWECKSAPCTPTGVGGNDTYLSNQLSTSTVDSTAGSYYVAGMTSSAPPTNASSLTIYMHTSDGTSPATNGYSYTFSNRFTAVSIYGNNSIVKNIAAKKSSGNGGSFGGGPDGSNATYTNIEADQGGKHNMICSGGCTVNNSKFVDEYYSGGGNMFVAFDQNGSGLPITLNNDIFLSGVATAGSGGITAAYGHVGAGAAIPNFIVNGGLVEGVNGGDFPGVSMAASQETVTGLTCVHALGCIVSYGTTTVSNVYDFSPTAAGATSFLVVSGSTGNTVSVSSSTACDLVGYNHFGINAGANKTSVSSSTFYFLGTTGGVAGVSFGGASSNLNMWGTTMDALANTFDGWVNDTSATSTAPYIGDYNIFAPNMWSGAVNNVGFHPLSAWQAATGQDAHSVATGSGSYACTVPQVAMTGPSSGSVNSPSASFTVTPGTAYNGLGSTIGYVGTITVTPSGTASAGLSPVTLNFTTAGSTTPQTFTITPTSVGTIALAESANGSTASPAFLASTTLTYTVTASAPSAPYGTPTATAGNTSATVSFYAPASIGGSAVTGYTVTSNPAGGTDSNAGSTALTHTVTGLTNGTSYTFTVTATNGAGTSPASSASNAVTPLAVPTVTVQAASSVTGTTATLNGTITNVGGSNATIEGFEYGPNTSYGTISSTTGSYSTGAYTASISGLTCANTYHYRAFATNAVGTASSTDQPFTTSACPAPTPSPSPVNSSGISFGGTSVAAQEANLRAIYAYNNLPCPESLCGAAPSASPASRLVSTTTFDVFAHSLRLGAVDPEVKSLQMYLNTHGYVIAPFGSGSPGNETDVFGLRTKRALMKFQKDHHLPASGFFGPMTRAEVGR